MTRKFFEKYGHTIREKLLALGASIKVTTDNPGAVFLSSDYKRVDWFSTVEKSMEYESKEVPKVRLKTLFRTW